MTVYVPPESTFISTGYFVLNLVSWSGVLSNKFIIFLIFHYYTIISRPRLSINFSLSSGDTYLSLGISLSFSFVAVSELFRWEFFETFVLFWYYFNLKSLIISCLFSGDIYFSLGISFSLLFVTVFELFCCEFLKTPVILKAILSPSKSPVASATFSVTILKKF